MRRGLIATLLLIGLLFLSLFHLGQAAPGPEEGIPPEEPAPESAASFPLITTPDPLVEEMVGQVLEPVVLQYMGDLSGEHPVVIDGSPYTLVTRYMKSATPIEKATRFVGSHLAGRGLAVEYHVWRSATAPNVIGELAGETRPGDIFMITAHLDDLPSGALAPGADDNASGSVAVMVASDILTQYRWSCTVRFAFWTGEEEGMLGSAKYAARARETGENILGVLNLDMIGWNTPGSSPDIDIHASSDRPLTVELAHQLASVVNAYGIDLVPEVVPNGLTDSDHAAFWQRGYTAILGMEDYHSSNNDFNPNYHTTGDTLAKLDLAYLTEFVKASVAGMAHMAGCRVLGPVVSSGYTGGEVELSWPTGVTDTSYEVHRSASPYFAPAAGTLIATIDKPVTGPAVYLDGNSGAGDTVVNDFYAISSLNAEGRGVLSNRTGEFDFSLVPGD